MADPTSDIMELRNQGLTDNIIMDELTKRGYTQEQIHTALSHMDTGASAPPSPNGSFSGMPSSAPSSEGNIYERIESITESIVDEKWDDLIAEVRKIIEWKERVESMQSKLNNDVEKLKEDFKTLHQGVLGKVEEYDKRMIDVGTELKAVGKVFKDVVPEFVENVKELKGITENVRKK
ncbi:hypothetical protein HOL21_04705 [Candidatus Woesearchaeota archaeon]|jgi:hypothetical protein|nr:hypothetical protein [Candidatus Woesearchaeota archaeon]MBT5397487.1 hypothetical protein [Candidatus Woesearchaeota archaeon]MBT5924614.1 hypothetical protein [Candidatus Woesearchaeota archaeon]MBT6367940.1 hypothetical protein [Candidatus Woesearchaeota archaeon]MBT7763164.1 hypothetical protein [Candidatus Woesearchaeota archaeon]